MRDDRDREAFHDTDDRAADAEILEEQSPRRLPALGGTVPHASGSMVAIACGPAVVATMR